MTDMITMQVIRYALEQIADEMGYTLARTGRSTLITEVKDFSCVVTNANGKTIAQAHHTPSFLAGFEITMQHLTKHYDAKDLAEGDVIICNDPYTGGQHIMDLYAIAPVFLDGELIGFVGNITHHSDLGGVAAGGVAGGINEIYLEGLRLPMIKLYKAGVEDKEIVAIITNQIRMPEKTWGDIRAQISALLVGVDRLKALHLRYTGAVVTQACNDLMDYSERRMREGLRQIPDGTYTGEDVIDDDGINDKPLFVRVAVTIDGDRAIVDLTESDPQAEGNTNSTLSNTFAAAYYVMIAVVDPGMPPNSGCYRAVEVATKPGTIVDPVLPGAVAARSNCSTKIVEAMMLALSKVVPDRVTACSHGQVTTCGFGGIDPKTGERFIFTDIQNGGNGGRPTADGADGQDSHLPRFMNTPVEAVERQFPVRVERYEFIPDSGGAGQYRGSLAMRRDLRFLVDKVSFARYGDRQKFQPFGLLGGKPGTVGRFMRNPGTNHEEQVASKGLDTLSLDDVISLQLPGAGGYGEPAMRDLDAIDRDLREEKVSADKVEEDYGVVVDRQHLRVDREATAAARAQLPAAE